jgi:ketosteroid isomerase-like protein
MSEESTTPNLVELTRHAIESAARHDLDEAMSVYGPTSIWDMSRSGIGTYEGDTAIRGLFEDSMETYEDLAVEVEEAVHLGNGVTLAMSYQRGRPVGSSGYVEVRYASVIEWTDGLIVRVTHYPNSNEARAAAERLAESRG